MISTTDRQIISDASVTISEGISVSVTMRPCTRPISAPETNPITIAAIAGTPWSMRSGTRADAKARTEPTERSNSPAIIKAATPIAMMPSSDEIVR